MRTFLLVVGLALLTGCAEMQKKPSASQANPSAAAPANVDLAGVEKAANEAYAKQDWSTSEANFALLTQKLPTNVEPWFKLGNIYARTNRFDLAVRAYREVLVRDTKHTRAWHNLGVVQLRQAALTFAELNKYAGQDDPLAARGQALGAAVNALLEPGGTSAAP